ncbi:class I tRNA ligase family protein [Candidatus Nitrosotalea sp. TS]|uniref:class I tRNA ligase family protein n=1 Tax=Candidatus Nitrosotalea sp. TS TaxID=2341020 RepID=UPI0014089B16|nr:class I tRNA ligase family protein [Candidatus Nitrosotalea sp. TS]
MNDNEHVMIKIFNSFSSNKDKFEPFEKNMVKVFICGPTLYDYTHVGHARIFLTYDLLCRHLRERGYDTDVLVNMTDINQNVFNKAKDESKDYHVVARFYAQKFAEDLNILNIKSVNRFAYVSDYVEYMESHISQLLEQKIAYYANGNVYLDISKDRKYGMLSKQSRNQLQLHRLDIGPNKKSQEDIMLWNCSDDFGFSWKSKFGSGIPWWHMQDTTVALENFGANYDIHGGARELLYPHHEAHLAQYKMFSTSENPVKMWMHVGLVLSNGEKMSKSLGNVVWSKDLAQKYGQNLLRLYIFSTHYREDVNFDEKQIIERRQLLQKINITGTKTSKKTDSELSVLVEAFFAALDDDLNSPKALEIFENICSKVIAGSNIGYDDFQRICQVLGIVL